MFYLPTTNADDATVHVMKNLIQNLQATHQYFPLHGIEVKHQYPLANLSKIFKFKVIKIQGVRNPTCMKTAVIPAPNRGWQDMKPRKIPPHQVQVWKPKNNKY